jgi:hypothetical protein
MVPATLIAELFIADLEFLLDFLDEIELKVAHEWRKSRWEPAGLRVAESVEK